MAKLSVMERKVYELVLVSMGLGNVTVREIAMALQYQKGHGEVDDYLDISRKCLDSLEERGLIKPCNDGLLAVWKAADPVEIVRNANGSRGHHKE